MTDARAGPPVTDPASDPTQRFGNRAHAYARARPRYPDAVVTQLARVLRLAPGAVVVDLGCGTGLSSEPFLRAGFRVIGVEPNPAMRAHALQVGREFPRFEVIDGRAEMTGLAQASADLVIAAQAFHWFDVALTRSEALRILRRPACAALLWNDRRAEGSEFARGYEELILEYSQDYLEIQHRHGRRERVDRFFGNNGWQHASTVHSDQLDLAMLCDRLGSASYMPAPGDERHAPMIESLHRLFARTARDGRVTMEFETRVLSGQMEPEPAPQSRPQSGPGDDGSGR